MPRAYYTIDVSWSYLREWISDNSGNKIYDIDLNPEFQRGYVWTKEQKVKYLEYILQNGESGKDIYFNHPNWMTSFKGRLVLVDGKQRLDAVLGFLNNEVKAFGYYYKEFEDKLDMLVAGFRIHIGNLETDKDIYNWYIAMNTGGTYHTNEEIDKVKKLIKELK
jgi:uncharacterized protein with ParB-like and HNH nuclease domain